MNFLAHLHIADFCHSDMTGNLLGDFVKGDPDRQYPLHIANGIRLHRFVDRYIDSHDLMLKGKHLFPENLKRFAPIALDMFWDHCLANQWKDFHKDTLPVFCRYAESQTLKQTGKGENFILPEKYLMVTQRMWSKGWLESYQDFSILEVALSRMSTRSPRLTALADCFYTLEDKYSDLRELFPELYKDILRASSEAHLGYTSRP